ncbi:unnamed protein product [Dovyalis caffra]|uniref:Uncharacterized protein n=1 Tax=Dovyalis caffra TaxID=77055 RepID=A0AAV1SEM5_9ROSI|nr:unnamed protein product [Dovyalis caffra]
MDASVREPSKDTNQKEVQNSKVRKLALKGNSLQVKSQNKRESSTQRFVRKLCDLRYGMAAFQVTRNLAFRPPDCSEMNEQGVIGTLVNKKDLLEFFKDEKRKYS